MDFFQVISLQEALERLRKQFAQRPVAMEQVALLEAQGRILAQDLQADRDLPDFNRSTVDGYAVRAMDTFGAGEALPSLVQPVGRVLMGQEATMTVQPGQAVAVPTGGMLPDGADSVVMMEYTEPFDENTIAVYKPVSPGDNLVKRGDDLKKEDMILQQGSYITSKHIAMLAACGVSTVPVYRPLRFAVISTGDEIIDITQQPKPGQIRDINSYGLAALIQQWGGQVVFHQVVQDDAQALQQAMEQGLAQADVLLLSGGSSVGEKDYTYQLMQQLCQGNVFVKGIAVKPGKPTIVGKAQGKPVFGLPGHPVAALMLFRVLMGALYRQWGMELPQQQVVATLSVNLPSAPGKTTFQMVQLEQQPQGFVATPVFGKSGMIRLLGQSDGYLILEDYQEGLNQGQQVAVYLL